MNLQRDEMELIFLKYKGHKYYFRLLDSYSDYKNSYYHFRVPVSIDSENGSIRIVCFKLHEEKMSDAQFVLEDKIKEIADKLETEEKTWQEC